jgi:hypothetical protein
MPDRDQDSHIWAGCASVQYFGPTHSSGRATASRRATEMVLRGEYRQLTPNWSSLAADGENVLRLVREHAARVLMPLIAVLQGPADAISKPAAIGMEQTAGQLPRIAGSDPDSGQ